MFKMKLIDKKQLYPMLKKQIKNPNLLSITILTFKKDRYIKITYQHGKFLFNEYGYEKKSSLFPTGKEVFHQLKRRSNVEFPHSKKIYLDIILRK